MPDEQMPVSRRVKQWNALPVFMFPDKYLRYLIALILVMGIVLRLTYYFQDYDLIIDEANIARNIYERNFAGLLLPLAYEQYAPPIFLWIEKLFSLLLGFGEKALRLYPLLCGIASLFVFYKILSKLIAIKAYWYPLALLAMGTIYVQYCAQVKQYMPDMLIGLLLIWAALNLDGSKVGRTKFILFWIITGSIAVWSSMSSVFILSGIGCYYGWPLWKKRAWKETGFLLLPVLVWIMQFLLYYFLILKSQISLDNLQRYHHEYFLYSLPANSEQWLHNGKRLIAVIGQMGGMTVLPLIFNILLLFIGIYLLARKKTEWLWLFGLPIVLVLLAAALHQYSLIERLILFLLPLGLVLIGFGLEKLMEMKSVALKIIICAIALVSIKNRSAIDILWRYQGFQEITYGLTYLKDHHVDGSHLYIHDSTTPTYIYYTQLHPNKQNWESLTGAKLLKWDSDYTVETKDIRDTVYFLYTGGFPIEEKNKRMAQIEQNLKQVDYYEKYICFVFGYAPKG